MYRCISVYTNSCFTHFHLFMYTYRFVQASQQQSRSSCRAARDSTPVYIIYTHMYLYTYVYMYMYTLIYIYIYIYVCIDIHVFICIHVYALLYIYKYVHTRTHIQKEDICNVAAEPLVAQGCSKCV